MFQNKDAMCAPNFEDGDHLTVAETADWTSTQKEHVRCSPRCYPREMPVMSMASQSSSMKIFAPPGIWLTMAMGHHGR